MLYGEIRPGGYFRFVNFGHPPPLVFSAEYEKFMDIDKARMVQFLALGLEIPEDYPDRNKYLSMALRTRKMNSSDLYEEFMDIDKARMVQFLALGLEIPEDYPDRNKYLSMALRTRKMNSSD